MRPRPVAAWRLYFGSPARNWITEKQKTMRKIANAALAVLILAAAFAAPVAAGPFEEGGAAYARGDYSTALAELTPLAKAGNVHAQRMLGAMYRQGQGTAKDAGRALYWTQEAVKRGDGGAQFNLANMYETGDTVAKNLALAAKWYKQAARAEMKINGRYIWKGEVPKWRVRREFAKTRPKVISSPNGGGATVVLCA